MKAQTMQVIANVSTVGTGGGVLFTWISENANVITVLCSALGVVATCVFYSFSIYLKMREPDCKSCSIED